MTYSTSKHSFVYCFSKKLAYNEEQYAINLQLLEKSITHIKGLYEYRLITDELTSSDVEHLSTNIQLIDTSDFIFLEDMKARCVSLLHSHETIVDPDLFIFKSLEYSNSFDVIFEHKDSPTKPWYTDNIIELKGTLLYERVKNTGTIPFVPNIGFFKINNDILLQTFTETYYEYRNDLLVKNIADPNRSNLILGQYLLGILLYEENFSYLDLRSTNPVETYTHLAGPDKYRKYNTNKPAI